MDETSRPQRGECACRRRKDKKFDKPKSCGKRKRQTMVFNPEEDLLHEPYMHCLRKEFSDISIPCDSKIELPWKDIALPTDGTTIRANIALLEPGEKLTTVTSTAIGTSAVSEKESTGTMQLPWGDLLVTDVISPQVILTDDATCDSTLEIPWGDLTFDKPIFIRAVPEEPCTETDIEIPWGEILIPTNISIKINKRKKHPSSSKLNPRSSDDNNRAVCGRKLCRVNARDRQ